MSHSHSKTILFASVSFFMGCGGPAFNERSVDSAQAVLALREGRFDEATKQAATAIDKSPKNAEALMVRAITRYRSTITQLVLDGRTVVGGLDAGGFNQRYLLSATKQAEADLAAIDADLAEAQNSKDASLELCLACWKDIDWNGDGRVNQRDSLLLQIETDEHGEPLPEGDPRRTPTFRFDHGDIAWARAFVGFERAALDIVLAYDYSAAADVLLLRGERPTRVTLKLVDRGRIAEAKKRFLEALNQSASCRGAYLAETDDDREWVPNPRQRNHPMPLPVDQALYDTWGDVLGDLRKLAESEEGIALSDIAELLKGEVAVTGARGFVDVGAMLERPRDIIVDMRDLEMLDHERVNLGALLSAMLGDYYVPQMKASPLPKRLRRMKGEVDAHQEDIEHKLRYLFWLN